MAGTMKSEAKEKVSEEEKTEPQMTEKEKVAAIEQDRADQAEEDEWMEREAVREVRELVQVLGRWAEKGVSAEGVRIITNAGFSRSGLEKLLKAADKKKLDAALEKPIGGADWEAIKAILGDEGAFATNSERCNDWAAKNKCATFCLTMVVFLLLAAGLAIAIIYGMKMHRNGRLFNVDSPLSYCEEGGDCENGFGKFVWRSGAYYEGQWVNGMRHGQGKFVYPSGHEPPAIEGRFVYGKIQEGFAPTTDGGFKSTDGDL